MNWLAKLIFLLFKDIADGILKLVGNYINNIFKSMYDLMLEFNFDELNKYSLSLGLALLGFLAVKQAVSVYSFHTDGDPDENPIELIMRVSIAVTVMVCGNWLIQELIKVAGIITTEVNNAIVKLDDTFTTTAEGLLLSFTGTEITSLINVILLLVVIISVILMIFKAAKRGAELILFGIALPIVACDLITTNHEKWSSFFNELLICIFGYIVQLLSFNIFLFFFLKSGTDYKYMFACLAWIMLSLGAPKWISKFTYSSGIGNVAKGAGRTAGFMLPSILRK